MQIDSLMGPWPWAAAVGYAQAVRVKDLITTGGIGPYDQEGHLVAGGFEDQVRQTFRNVETILAAFGADLANVVSMSVFVSDPSLYPRFTAVRPEFLSAPFPASTATGATLLVEGMLIEMNATALLGTARVAVPDPTRPVDRPEARRP